MSPDQRDPGRARPYAVTGGRTRPEPLVDLPLEALVGTTPRGMAALPLLVMEWRGVAALCERLSSLAEVAGRLEVPLGVARVLVADMAARGLVDIHRPGGQHRDGSDPDLLIRVLDGLRAI